ncbi:8502_t:CDS:2, partial [Funneliformis geosporum]
KIADKIGRIRIGITNDVNIILNGIWDENWSKADDKPVDNIPVALNAGSGLSAITIASE